MAESKVIVESVDDLLEVPDKKEKAVLKSGRFRRVLSTIRKPAFLLSIAAAGMLGGTIIGTAYSEGIRDWAYNVQRSYAFWAAPDDGDIIGDFKEKDALYNTYQEQRASDKLRDDVCGVVNLDDKYECRRIR